MPAHQYLILDAAGNAVGAGYTPDGTLPEGAIVCTDEQAQAWATLRVEGGVIGRKPSMPESEQARIAQFTVLVQEHLDATARTRDDFDGILNAVTYADEPSVPAFQAKGRQYRAWRSLVWAACYSILDNWRAGNRPEPTVEQLIAELPSLESIQSA